MAGRAMPLRAGLWPLSAQPAASSSLAASATPHLARRRWLANAREAAVNAQSPWNAAVEGPARCCTAIYCVECAARVLALAAGDSPPGQGRRRPLAIHGVGVLSNGRGCPGRAHRAQVLVLRRRYAAHPRLQTLRTPKRDGEVCIQSEVRRFLRVDV